MSVPIGDDQLVVAVHLPDDESKPTVWRLPMPASDLWIVECGRDTAPMDLAMALTHLPDVPGVRTLGVMLTGDDKLHYQYEVPKQAVSDA